MCSDAGDKEGISPGRQESFLGVCRQKVGMAGHLEEANLGDKRDLGLLCN